MEAIRECVICHKDFPLTLEYFYQSNRHFCKKCKRCFITSQKERRLKNFNNGSCKSCITPRLKYSNTYCLKHWFQNIAQCTLGKRSLWKDIKRIAEEQHYECVYTGEKLVPVLNMSLDHIESKCDAPDRIQDITNLQWVTKDINLMKNKFSHSEFYTLCQHVVDRCSLRVPPVSRDTGDTESNVIKLTGGR